MGTLVAMRAAMLGIILETLEVTVDSQSDDRGLLGIDEAVPAGPLNGRVAVRLVAGGVEPATLSAHDQRAATAASRRVVAVA